MSAHLKACAAAAAGSFAAILLLSLAGHWIRPEGDKQKTQWMLAAFLALTAVLAFSLAPLLVRAFLSGQAAIGNAEVSAIRWARAREDAITYGVWGVWLAGLLIAAPVMRRDLLGWTPELGPSQGLLSVDIGMTLDEVRARSTLKLPEPLVVKATGQRKLIADAVFDFEIPGGGIRFPSCRYYWIDTGAQGDPKVAFVSIGVSPGKLTRAELAAAHKTAREHLAREGWRESSEGRGVRWLKGGTQLSLLGKRVDEEARGEDPETAGAWFQYVELARREGAAPGP